MDTIASGPINLAHLHWRSAEHNLCVGNKGESVDEFKRAIQELERAKRISRDMPTVRCIQKQIEFHKRRIELLRMFSLNLSTDVDNVLSEEGVVLLQGVFEEIREDSNMKETEVQVNSEQEGSTIANLVECDHEILPDGIYSQDTENTTSSVMKSEETDKNEESETEQIKALVSRIEELESENRDLRESLQREQSENIQLKQHIIDLKGTHQ